MSDEPRSYNLVVHRPYSVDSCRSCVMARYPSKFETYTELDSDAVVDQAAAYLALPLEQGEAGYTILLCGASAGRPFMVDLQAGYTEDPVVEQLRARTAAEVARILEDRKESEQRIRAEARARATQEREARERAELARLKERYGP